MSAINLIGRLRGYVVIQADGYFTERFLNICMRRGILLWDVKRMGETRLYACISIAGFLQLRQIASKTKTHVKIVKRCGLPFFLHRYRKRKPVLAGILLFALIIFYMSSHVMGIDISGAERIPQNAIMEGLREFGLYPGAKLSRLSPQLIQNQMMTKLDDIAWIGINIKGSHVYIKVKERLGVKRELNKNEPCNLIAANSGIIRLLEVKEGQTVVAVNTMVEKGDLLVSGILDSSKEGIRYVHSFGNIYADTIYKKSREYPIEFTEKIYTGNKKVRYSMKLLGYNFNLYLKNRAPYENFDKSFEEKTFKSNFSFFPHVLWKKDTFAEYTPKKTKRSLEQIVALGKKELGEEIEKELDKSTEIKNVDVSYLPLGNKVLVTVEYACRENIALQSPIDKIENLNYDIDST